MTFSPYLWILLQNWSEFLPKLRKNWTKQRNLAYCSENLKPGNYSKNSKFKKFLNSVSTLEKFSDDVFHNSEWRTFQSAKTDWRQKPIWECTSYLTKFATITSSLSLSWGLKNGNSNQNCWICQDEKQSVPFMKKIMSFKALKKSFSGIICFYSLLNRKTIHKNCGIIYALL